MTSLKSSRLHFSKGWAERPRQRQLQDTAEWGVLPIWKRLFDATMRSEIEEFLAQR